MKNTRLFGLFHTSDPSLSRDNSRVVKVIVDDLITGLGPSFYMAKTISNIVHVLADSNIKLQS